MLSAEMNFIKLNVRQIFRHKETYNRAFVTMKYIHIINYKSQSSILEVNK